MNIKVSQCEIGRFNLASSEKSLSFYMSIYENNTVVVKDGVKAQLHYSGDPEDIQYFEDVMGNLGQVFDRCVKYASRVWSSTDYFAQCMLFAKVYTENFEQITAEYVENRNRGINRQIEQLQKELADESPLSGDLYETSNFFLNEKIKQYTGWVYTAKKELEQIKEGTDKYIEVAAKIERYQKDIDGFSAKLILKSTEH